MEASCVSLGSRVAQLMHAALQAQQAYLCGNRAQAKQLSQEGRAANERMHAAHAAAAEAIYAQRNPAGMHLLASARAAVWLGSAHLARPAACGKTRRTSCISASATQRPCHALAPSCSCRSGCRPLQHSSSRPCSCPTGGARPGERTMDLHGLHVAEALAQLSKQVGAARGTPNPPRLTVVTGAGIHTKVRCLCQRWRLRVQKRRVPGVGRAAQQGRGRPGSHPLCGLACCAEGLPSCRGRTTPHGCQRPCASGCTASTSPSRSLCPALCSCSCEGRALAHALVSRTSTSTTAAWPGPGAAGATWPTPSTPCLRGRF